MAQGETKWSSSGKQAIKYVRIPLPSGDYDLKINAADWSVEKKPDPGSTPYIKGMFEALNTATTEGGKNRKVFFNLWLSLVPGKDGACTVERANGVNGMAKGFGEECSFSVAQAQKKEKDGSIIKIPIANPQEVLKWVKAHDGAVLKAHVKVKKQKNYDDQNEIEYFIEAESGAANPDGEDYQMDTVDSDASAAGLSEGEESDEETGMPPAEEDVSESFKPSKTAAKGKPISKRR